MAENRAGVIDRAPSYKRGGRVRKTGLIKAHKNELITPAKNLKGGKRGFFGKR